MALSLKRPQMSIPSDLFNSISAPFVKDRFDRLSQPQKYAVLIVSGVSGVCIVRYVFWKLYNRFRAYPNGPLGLPLLGCLVSFGANTLSFLAHSGSAYGALTYFPMLLSNNVLISDPKTLDQLYKTAKLLDRPAYSHRQPLEFSVVNGPNWTMRRKFASQTVVSLAKSGFILSKVNKAFTEYVEPIMQEKYANENSELCSLWKPRELMQHIVFNNVWSTVFGISLSLDDPFIPKFTELIDEFFQSGSNNFMLQMMTNFSRGRILDFLHWHVSGKVFEAGDKALEEWMNSHGFIVDRTKNILARRDSSNVAANKDQSLYVDVLMEAVQNNQMTVKQVLADIGLMLEAAIHTTSGSAEYMFLLLAKYPKIQEMVFEELQTVMKKNNLKAFDFRILNELHVFRAFIYEGLRISCVAPTGLPHIASRDATVEVNGKECVIPKGTLLHANSWYIQKYLDWNNNNQPLKCANDEIHLEYWLQPSDDGHESKFKMNENFVLFGMGRRDCVGQALAIKQLYAIFGVMMTKYKFVAAGDDPDAIEIRQKMGISMVIDPAVPIRVQKR